MPGAENGRETGDVKFEVSPNVRVDVDVLKVRLNKEGTEKDKRRKVTRTGKMRKRKSYVSLQTLEQGRSVLPLD